MLLYRLKLSLFWAWVGALFPHLTGERWWTPRTCYPFISKNNTSSFKLCLNHWFIDLLRSRFIAGKKRYFVFLLQISSAWRNDSIITKPTLKYWHKVNHYDNYGCFHSLLSWLHVSLDWNQANVPVLSPRLVQICDSSLNITFMQ